MHINRNLKTSNPLFSRRWFGVFILPHPPKNNKQNHISFHYFLLNRLMVNFCQNLTKKHPEKNPILTTNWPHPVWSLIYLKMIQIKPNFGQNLTKINPILTTPFFAKKKRPGRSRISKKKHVYKKYFLDYSNNNWITKKSSPTLTRLPSLVKV